MANTTNFNWETPDDTDLVKDGAAAIRTLGSAIDTSLVDLKGGTTGQVLSKATNTDMDFTWVAQDDSNAIQNAIIDAKGDLIVGTAADTPARLAVGSNDQVLTADSSTATGLKWATASSGASFAGVSLQNSTNAQSIPNNTSTKLTFDTEVYDVGGYAAGGSTITIPSGKAGYYAINGSINFANSASGYRAFRIYKNGAEKHGWVWYNGGDAFGMAYFVINLAVSDTIEFYVQQNSGGNLNFYKQNDSYCYFQLTYLGA